MWINASTRKIYDTEHQIFADFPNTSFPQPCPSHVLEAHNIFQVTECQPVFSKKAQKAVTFEVQNQGNNNWVQVWVIEDLGDEEKDGALKYHSDMAQEQVRALLYRSDWTQVADAPLSPNERAAWAAYRQLLRSVNRQAGFPWDIVWPVAP